MGNTTKIIFCILYTYCITTAQRNLSPFGNATQSSTHDPYNASLAIIGGPTNDFSSRSCSHTAWRSVAWWMLQLPNNTMFIEQVNIFYRGGYSRRLDGYSLYLSNTSISGLQQQTPPGILCYRDQVDKIAPENQTIACNELGKYVIIYNDNKDPDEKAAFLELCDVQVIGCSKLRFGHDCSRICSTKCFDQHCFPSNGSCVFGCNCLGDICDGHASCITGCKNGFTGQYCNEVCPFRTFGENCSHSCHCRNESTNCNPTDGTCGKGECNKGWHGMNCSIECPGGSFGFNCRENCSHCLNKTCDRFSGDCISGCVNNYYEGICAANAQQHTESSFLSTIAIAGVAIVVTIAVILIIFVLRRRNKKNAGFNHLNTIQSHNILDNDTTEGSREETGNFYINVQPRTSTNNTEVTLQKLNQKKEGELNISYDDDNYDVYDNNDDDEYAANDDDNTKTKTQYYNIDIEELAQHINKKLGENGFETEYESLPTGHVYPHTEGTKKKNKLKNRFLSTWPYDHSRVVLKGDKSSDYINASYIDNYSKEKAYIATQGKSNYHEYPRYLAYDDMMTIIGPKRNTIEDFWEMIWQEGVKVIVMVTQLEESGRKKCEQYWPELQQKCLVIGHFKISMCKEMFRTVYVERVFTLHNKKDHTERTIHQFHFTQWPDHGVPDIITLVTFYRKVKKDADHYDVSMVVHCSAGIGRTGTFLAIDALYEHGLITGFINVMEYAQMMRKDRMNMIQTKDQYQTVFEALLELFTVPDTSLAREDFRKVLEKEQIQHVPKNQTKLYLEFQRLNTLKPIYFESSYSTARSEKNRAKNGNSILAHDKYRPILMSADKDGNNYINAVILPEYSSKNQIIITQYPLKDTVVDFWTLIYDHQCSVVVLLEKPSSETPLWTNTDTPLNCRMFTIQTVKEGSEVNIKLTNKTNREERQVSVYLMNQWTSDDLPSSSSSILDLISNVSQKRERNIASLAVVDRDGASRSGLFVALTLILQKLQMDDEVDIFQIVRMMQVRRPEFLTNVVQYEYCYQCVKEYLDRNSLYANT